MKTGYISFLSALVLFPITLAQGAESVPKQLIGDWTLYLSTDEPAWLKVEEVDGEPVVHMRVHVQSVGPHKIKEFKNGRLTFDMKIKREIGQGGAQTKVNTVSVGLKKGKLDGVINGEWDEKKYNRITFTGKKFPPIPPAGSFQVRLATQQLFNGKDLTGWVLDNRKRKTAGG